MKKFKEVSKKIVSIKAFAKRTYLDDEATTGVSTKGGRPSRDMLLTEVLKP